MIDRGHDLPISKQAAVLRISRGSIHYLPRPVPEADLAIMRRLDHLHLEFPFAGSRMLRGLLVAEGCKIGRRHVKMRRSASKHWRMHWLVTANPMSSTPTRGRSSPAWPSP